MNLKTHSQIRRTMTIDGVSIPAFIENGSYFKTSLDIFHDGIINAWGTIDIDFFKEKIKNGWIQSSVPNGENVSIFHLSQFTIKNGKWTFNAEEFQQYVLDIIHQLNPQRENLYNFYGTDVRLVNKVCYAKNVGAMTPIIEKKQDEYRSKILEGTKISIFKRIDKNTFYLCQVDIFPDGTLRINDLPTTELLSFEKFKDQSGKDFISEIKKDSKVIIHGLGEFEIENTFWQNEINDVVGGVADEISKLNNQPDSSDICHSIYKEYLAQPSPQLKEKLKVAYEAIPTHLRMYILGDMDSKDYPIQEIIYEK